MTVKLYQIFCSFCGFKRITDGSDCGDLTKVAKSKLQGTIPKWNEEKSETVEGKWLTQIKSFKCPDCGRSITPIKIERSEHLKEDRKEDEEQNWFDGS